MLSKIFRTTRSSIVVVGLLAGSASTANAETDKKETTKKTWAVDSSHGTYSDSISIEVPAFHGITPELALAYGSTDGNSELGVGWSLGGVGIIERASPGKGTPNYDESDIFLLDGQELIACAPDSVSPSCTTGGTHSTKIESYKRIALSGVDSASRWTITTKDGVRQVFAPVFSLSGGADVFRWGLHEVTDTKDNVVTYHWGTDQLGCCWEHLDSVTYAGTTVTFHYEVRTDHELAAIGDGAIRTVHGRIKTIDVTVGGSRLRAYKLGYMTSVATSRSLLTSVQQFGADAELDGSGTVTSGTSLPAITIEYQSAVPAFAEGDQDLSLNNDSADSKAFAIDIDGDGRTDMLELYPLLTSMRRRTWISNGVGFDETSDEPGMSTSKDARFLPMDVDGDGSTDLVEVYPSLLWWGLRTWISNGSGFDEASNDGAASSFSENSHFIAMDINGDGKSDLLELRPNFLSYRRVSWISTGTGFTEGSDEPGITYSEDARFFAMDVNGDGMSDLLELSPGFASWNRRIWLSHGAGFSEGAADSIDRSEDDDFIPMDINGDGKTDLLHIHPFLAVSHRRAWLSTGNSFTLGSDDPGALFSSDNWYLAIDVNGDGRSDLVEMDQFGAGLYRRRIWRSEGGRFVAGPEDTDMGYDSSTKLMAADVDGDGLSEMIELYPFGLVKSRRVWLLTGGKYPDLLASLTNSLGGTTSVSYTPSSAWDNTNNPPLMQTATAVTATDGRGGSATTLYEYAGGLHDRPAKRFLGYRYQLETLPCIDGEAACPHVETWFRQDHGAASKPERIDRRVGSGQLLRSEVYEYTTNGATVPWTSLPTGEWAYTYVDGGAECPGAECKRTYTARTFDEYGELAVEVDHGDYDASGDERTLTTTFVPNTEAYIVDRPAEAKTFAGVGTGGTLLNETLSYYDDAKGWDQAPTAGLPTATVRWLSSPSSFVETRKEYDAWGNVVAEIDAVGARTSYTFDPNYHLFQTGATNALGQATIMAWDVVCGAPTQTTDLNGQATTMTYDPLCRMTERVEPGGRYERHTWVNLGDAGDQHELVETPAADGTAQPSWTRTYFDGFRRTWRTVAKGPDAATGDIHVDTTYNARGQEASVTAAYYAVSGEAPAATYATTSSYDALDRRTRVTHPDGAFTTTTHGLWFETHTDELGRARTDRFDADGHRVEHDEVVGDKVRTTTYAYDARGNLVRSTDPLDNVITYEKDSLGRQTRIDDPDLGASTYEYDGADRLTAQTDARGQRTELRYDALGRKIGKTSLAGTDAAVTVSWTHDEVRAGQFNVGKLTTMTDEAGSETFDHDVAGNLVKTVRTIDGERYAFEHGYDAGGRKLWTTYPDGDTLGTPSSPLSYDGAGRLASIPSYVEAGRYDAGGALIRLDNANGTVTTRERSPERGWLTTISTTAGASKIQDLTYTRDAKGKITQIASPHDDEAWTYEYDELDRLIAATNDANPEYDQTLEYDAIGNITYNSRLGSYRYESKQPHAVTAAGANTYAYDAAGLMTSRAGRTLTWDGDNRLASITGASRRGGDGEAADDDAAANGSGAAAGRGFPRSGLLALVPLLCVRRRRAANAGPYMAMRPGFAYGVVGLALALACSGDSVGGTSDGDGDDDDDAPPGADEMPDDADPDDAAALQFTYDANGARIQQVEGKITRRHLGDGYEIEVGGGAIKYVSLAGSIVARKQGDTRTWVHTDHLGSIQAATDTKGAEVHRKKYCPYGEILATAGPLAFEPRGYTGQRHDASNLMYLHARYYDPAIARFISPDSIIDGDDTIGLNRYAYVGNDPVNHNDVGGQCKDGASCGIGKGVGAGLKKLFGPALGALARGGAMVGVTALVGAAALAPPAPPSLFGYAMPEQQTVRTVGPSGSFLNAEQKGLIGKAQELGEETLDGVNKWRQERAGASTSSAGPGTPTRTAGPPLRQPQPSLLSRLGTFGGNLFRAGFGRFGFGHPATWALGLSGDSSPHQFPRTALPPEAGGADVVSVPRPPQQYRVVEPNGSVSDYP
jgi:RHS repeat-associated protein